MGPVNPGQDFTSRNSEDSGAPRLPDTASLEFLGGGGAAGALMRVQDWGATAFADPADWPQSLRSALSICLESDFQIAIYWGPELALIYNDSWSQILGDKHSWALGRPAREVWPEIWDTIGPLFRSVLATGKATRSRDALLAMHRRGFTEECYFDYTFSPIRDESGAVGGIFNIAVETTYRVLEERRQRLLRELQDATAPARTAAEVCTLAVQTLASDEADLPFCMIYLADTGPAGTTLRLAASTGIPLPSPLIPGVLEPGISPWPAGEALAGKAAILVEDLGRKFGSPVDCGPWPEPCERALLVPLPGLGVTECAGILIAGISPRLLPDVEYHSFVERVAGSLAADIANARAYQEERRRAEALAEIDRAKTAFFSNVSHEFRTPLTLMLGPIEDTLEVESALSAGAREHLELAHRNGLRLQKLVNALLDFSRIEAGRAQAVCEPTDLARVTADLASNFRAACEKAGLRYTVDCAPLEEPIYVDREMWEKIVLNLLSNAFKFTLAGSITVTLKLAGPNVELTISDTGTGIPAAELPQLFERFHRVEGAAGRSMEGSGIGLALVQELIKLQGGSVRVESTIDQGSTFHVFLPRGTGHLPKERIGVSRRDAFRAQPQIYVEEALHWLAPSGSRLEAAPGFRPARDTGVRRGRILLADDNADMREYIQRILRGRFEVTAVANGEEALRSARLDPPDVILTDVMMPRLDGFGLLRALRSDPATRTISVILLSARAGEESRIEGLNAGADDYLIKPFSARELIARVSGNFEMARLRKEAFEASQRSESALREHQLLLSRQIAEFETLFRELPVGVAVARDPECDRIRINPSLAELLGVSPDENASATRSDGIALPFRMLRGGREVSSQELPMQTAVRKGQPVRGFEFDIVRADGGLRTAFGHAMPLFDDSGEVRGGIGVFVDITERKRTEEALRQSEAELRRANQDLEQFAYSAAHDLQEPLRSVSIYSELLQRGYGDRLDAQADQYIAYCREAAVRMGSLIQDLLAYARAAASPDEAAEVADLNSIVSTALRDLDATIEETGAEIHVGPLPSLSVEPVRLQRLFQNLIGNALKYHKDGEAPRVRVSADRREGSWVFSVEDNGIGIEAQYHKQVFGTFKRLHSRSRTGSGLGLAICQRIVERYGGRIWVESEPGQGSNFQFSLPLTLDPRRESR